jgi:transposase
MPKSISSQKKWEIIFLHLKEEGPKLSISKTAKKLKISTYTVKHWIRVFRETGDVLEKKSTGRPRKTSHSEDEQIVNLMENDRGLRLKDISEEMKRSGISLCNETIRRRLNEAGLKFTSASKKPLLSKFDQMQRLRFARQNKTRNWNKVIFTDQTSISLAPRKTKIWKRRREKNLL